jgi:hypothetical protein
VERIPAGLSMFTAGDRNDPKDRRIATYLTQFTAAAPPDPAAGAWESWMTLMGAKTEGEPVDSMSFATASGFGTSSASLLALPSVASAHADPPQRPVWLFAPGPPDSTAFAPVALMG